MAERLVAVPGGRLFTIDDGVGPPIVLLHAGIADLRSWDTVAPGLVDAGYRAIRYDARGFGATETEDVPFSNRADVLAVLDALGIKRAAFVGNSRGGHIALDTAIESPDRIVAVVGVTAGLGGFEGTPGPEEAELLAEMERLEEQDPPDLDAIAAINVGIWVAGPGQPLERVPAHIRDLVAEMTRAISDPGRVQGQPIPLEPRAAARLSELTCPVLAVAGELDVSTSAQTARYLETHAPRARAVILPDVAHMIGMEQPATLARLVVEFLAPLGAWS